jgi:uncharacterized membrane protein
MLAAIRSDSVNLPLFLHVLGAMVLVGSLAAVAFATFLGRRGSDRAPGLARFSLKTLLVGALPAYVVLRIGAQWTEAEQDYPDDFEASWLDIGYIVADLGALLLLISVILAAIGLRRSREDASRSVRLARIVAAISVLLLAAFLVAIWAMTAKPD